MSNSSCGVCGKRDLSDLQLGTAVARLQPRQKLDPALLAAMTAKMAERQDVFKSTGGCHAAAAFTINGQLLEIHEDVGRHNAVDKVIGALLENRTLDQAQCLHVSERVSYEIVSKTHRAAICYLIAVSSPSSMAVEITQTWGITLIAFCRDGRATVYANRENILLENQGAPCRNT